MPTLPTLPGLVDQGPEEAAHDLDLEVAEGSGLSSPRVSRGDDVEAWVSPLPVFCEAPAPRELPAVRRSFVSLACDAQSEDDLEEDRLPMGRMDTSFPVMSAKDAFLAWDPLLRALRIFAEGLFVSLIFFSALWLLTRSPSGLVLRMLAGGATVLTAWGVFAGATFSRELFVARLWALHMTIGTVLTLVAFALLQLFVVERTAWRENFVDLFVNLAIAMLAVLTWATIVQRHLYSSPVILEKLKAKGKVVSIRKRLFTIVKLLLGTVPVVGVQLYTIGIVAVFNRFRESQSGSGGASWLYFLAVSTAFVLKAGLEFLLECIYLRFPSLSASTADLATTYLNISTSLGMRLLMNSTKDLVVLAIAGQCTSALELIVVLGWAGWNRRALAAVERTQSTACEQGAQLRRRRQLAEKRMRVTAIRIMVAARVEIATTLVAVLGSSVMGRQSLLLAGPRLPAGQLCALLLVQLAPEIFVDSVTCGILRWVGINLRRDGASISGFTSISTQLCLGIASCGCYALASLVRG